MTAAPVLLLAAVLAAASAAAQIGYDDVKRLRDSGVILPLDAIIAGYRHQPRPPGERILEAELEFEDGRYVYELKVLSADGRVQELEYDAQSGELLHIEGHH